MKKNRLKSDAAAAFRNEQLDVDLTVELEGIEYDVNLAQLGRRMKIDPNQLKKEASEQPGLYVFVAGLAEEASAAASRARRSLDLYRSTVAKRLRAGGGEKKIAQAHIEHLVDMDDGAQELADEYLEANRVAALLGAAKEACRQRAGLIRELMANERSEMASGV